MENFKKIKEKIFKRIPGLDAEIRTVENGQYEDKSIYWIVEVGLCESMGERGYIYTFFYDDKPTDEEIIKDTKQHIKDQIEDFKNKFCLCAYEEQQLKILEGLKL